MFYKHKGGGYLVVPKPVLITFPGGPKKKRVVSHRKWLLVKALADAAANTSIPAPLLLASAKKTLASATNIERQSCKEKDNTAVLLTVPGHAVDALDAAQRFVRAPVRDVRAARRPVALHLAERRAAVDRDLREGRKRVGLVGLNCEALARIACCLHSIAACPRVVHRLPAGCIRSGCLC